MKKNLIISMQTLNYRMPDEEEDPVDPPTGGGGGSGGEGGGTKTGS